MRRIDPKKSQYKILLAVIVIGAVLSVMEGFSAFEPIKKGVQQVTIPVQVTLFRLRQNVNNAFITVNEVGKLRSQNVQLSEENALLTAENEKLRKLAGENKTLREQLGVASSKKQNLIAAKTMGFSPLVSKRLLLIDKGEVSGIKKGMLVVVKDILVGQIYEVTPRSSSVQLISDPDTKIPSITNKKVRGMTVGQFGAEIELTEVVQSETLSVGDLVLTTGEGGYSAGLILGKIKEVKKVEKELFQKATISPLVSLEDLAAVFVVSEK